MANSQAAWVRVFLGLLFFAVCAAAVSNDDCVFRDSFQCGPDRKGPTIQIIEPESWVDDRTVTVIFEDESGIAAFGAQGFGGFPRDWEIVWDHPKTLTKQFSVSNLEGLLGDGADITIIAQDIYGNYSRETATFTAQSAITPGTYALSESYVSEVFNSDICARSGFDVDPSSLHFKVESINVSIYVSHWSPRGSCVSGQPCLQIAAGSFVGLDSNGDEVVLISGRGLSQLLDFETDLVFSGRPILERSDGGGLDYAVGSKISGVFSSTDPQEITAEVTFYCSNKYESIWSEAPFECPDHLGPDCVVETFGPFIVQGTLGSN